MDDYTPSQTDWKLFRERLPVWQQNHMIRLCEEYAAVLTGSGKGGEAFWEIEKRIRRDKLSPGVITEVKRSMMLMIISRLLIDRVIGWDDLEPFSDDVKARIRILTKSSHW